MIDVPERIEAGLIAVLVQTDSEDRLLDKLLFDEMHHRRLLLLWFYCVEPFKTHNECYLS